MMIAWIERVVATFNQLAGFHSLIGLIGVHRPEIELNRAEPKRGANEAREDQIAKEGGRHGTMASLAIGTISRAGRKPQLRRSDSIRRKYCHCCTTGRNAPWHLWLRSAGLRKFRCTRDRCPFQGRPRWCRRC